MILVHMKLKDFMFMEKILFIFIIIYFACLIYFFIFSDYIWQTTFPSGLIDQFPCNLLVCSGPTIIPLMKFSNLSDKNISLLLKKELGNKGGVYGILNTESDFQYIGSSFNLHSRLMDHIKGRYSNLKLQRAIKKIGILKFNILIYYFHTEPDIILTDIETKFIFSFPFDSLYNFKKEAISMVGYKHMKQAIAKMKLHYLNKNNHPMFGKKHTELSLSLISKPGNLNLMFGKKHKLSTKILMSLKKSSRPLGLYDINNIIIEKFINQVELAKKFNVHKSTVSKYVKSGKLFKDKYYIKELN